ncbi:unnamed protein product [Calypogeia fissa]
MPCSAHYVPETLGLILLVLLVSSSSAAHVGAPISAIAPSIERSPPTLSFCSAFRDENFALLLSGKGHSGMNMESGPAEWMLPACHSPGAGLLLLLPSCCLIPILRHLLVHAITIHHCVCATGEQANERRVSACRQISKRHVPHTQLPILLDGR